MISQSASLWKIGPAFIAFQILLTSLSQAKEPSDRSQEFAQRMNEILVGLKDTRYQSKTVVNSAKGVFRCNCSGLISHILRRHFPESYLTVRGKNAPWKIRPLAVTYYETFVAATEHDNTKPGWRRVQKMMDIKPGDIIAWRKPSLIQGRHTGHIVMAASKPILESDGRVKIRVADSTSRRHANDTRPRGVKGVGAGDMWFAINKEGEPVGYWLNEKPRQSKTNKIAIGRLVPIKIQTALHPKAIPLATKKPSPDYDFLGMTQKQAIKLAGGRNLKTRIIVIDNKRKPVSKTLNDDRVNLIIKDGKVIRTIRG